ncbi:TPA: transposase [Escherichia coli]|nr:transposase [Escherichia coli]
MAATKQALANNALTFPPDQQTTELMNLSNKLGRIDWQVYACAPYAHGVGVAKYLARYMRGGAINNKQLIAVKNNMITFKYKSHQTKKTERQQVSLPNFTRMVLKHLPLKGKPTIRYYGIYHPTVVEKLNVARAQCKQAQFITAQLPTWQAMLNKLGIRLICPICGVTERIAAAPLK